MFSSFVLFLLVRFLKKILGFFSLRSLVLYIFCMFFEENPKAVNLLIKTKTNPGFFGCGFPFGGEKK